MIHRYFKTGNRMRVAIDNAHRINGMLEYLDQYYLSSYDLDLDDRGYGALPYWIEHRQYESEDDLDLKVRHIEGIQLRKNIGEIDQIDGKNYELVDTVTLDPELEVQAADGEFDCWCRGYSFLEIWRRNRLRELIVDGHWGIHIPTRFLEIAEPLGVELSEHDKGILSNPEHPDYWECWDEILSVARSSISPT